eukprot:8262718-Pyramimonas_sp.AAC.1
MSGRCAALTAVVMTMRHVKRYILSLRTLRETGWSSDRRSGSSRPEATHRTCRYYQHIRR